MLDCGSWDIRCDFSCIVPLCTLCKLSLDQWMVHVFSKLHGLYVHVAARPPRPPRWLRIDYIQTKLDVDLVVKQNLFWLAGRLYLQVSGLGQIPVFFHPKQTSSVCLPFPLPIRDSCWAGRPIALFLIIIVVVRS